MRLSTVFTTAALTLFFSYSFISCSDDEGMEPQATEYASLNDFFEANKKDAETFTIDASTGGVITGAEGTEITIPANAFLDGSNNPVTGTVDIELQEFYSKKDLFYNNLPTESNGQWLVTGGSLNFEASQNGNPLTLVASGVTAFMPDQTDAGNFKNNMMQFEGQRANNNPNAPVNWVLADDRQIAYSVSSPVGYTMENMGQFLRNCDAFYNDPGPKTQFSTSLTGVTDLSQARLWMFVDGLATVIGITTQNGSNLDTYANSIPVGTTATLFAFTTEKGYLEFGTTDIIVTGDDQFNVNLGPGTQQAMDNFLATVD